MEPGLHIVSESYQQGQSFLAKKTKSEIKGNGQYLTPPTAARFMADQLTCANQQTRVLDPASGSGTLACAVIERAIERGFPKKLHVDAFELDSQLCRITKDILTEAATLASSRGIDVDVNTHNEDFILSHLPDQAPSLFDAPSAEGEKQGYISRQYDWVIANPPYFKLKKEDPRRKAATAYPGNTNIYTLFMGLAADLMKHSGSASFLVPRSFCSGAYFKSFRSHFLQENDPIDIHLFESRGDNFEGNEVLQENLILLFQSRSRGDSLPEGVKISTSQSASDLSGNPKRRNVSLSTFLGGSTTKPIFRLPGSELDEKIIQAIDNWTGSFAQYDINVSTGPVVAYRNREYLCDETTINSGDAVPLLWLHNVRAHCVEPRKTKEGKHAGVKLAGEDARILVPAANYVLMRRFTSKEEKRRLVLGPFIADDYDFEFVGLENHLNYLYRGKGQLTEQEACGLSAFLGSALIDRYFRICNGNTQVNATELRALPLPPMEVIRDIGRKVPVSATGSQLRQINRTVFETLWEQGFLPLDIPLINETRLEMTKIQEAQDVLQSLGLPSQQQNEISALTLLVLAQLDKGDSWAAAKRRSLGITEMMEEMRERYDKEYAPNTRETVRRKVIHQLCDAGVVVKNPDDPSLPTNSPNTHYSLTDAAIRTIRRYNSTEWEEAATSFLENQSSVIARHQRQIERHKVPLTLPTGEEYMLSPGIHNQLQADIVNKLGPTFTNGGELLYLGDTADKMLHIDEDGLAEVGFSMNEHDKLPDVVIHDRAKNRLWLIEAVTSHGPISQTRFNQLEAILSESTVRRVYVSAFPDFATFKSFMEEIAWETEVWLADTPDHMIHFNGSHFLNN